MFLRNNKELSFQHLRLESLSKANSLSSSLSTSLSSLSSSSSFAISEPDNNEKINQKQFSLIDKQDITFQSLINTYNENFLVISQKDKAAFLNLTLSDIIRLFSMPICTKDDGKTCCKPNCDCFRSLEIGMQLYEKGGVQSFNQFGNYLIGYLIEQQTDPMTRISIEMDSQMRVIKNIHCPCKFYYCPHAFALLYFRIKLPTFYAIKLPQQIYSENLPQNELIKFYGYLVEESRSLPIMCDYQNKQWTQDQLKNYIDVSLPNGSALIYGYCHKSLLPISNNIIEEQARARKWISDLHTKRSFSYSNIAPTGNNFDANHGNNQGRGQFDNMNQQKMNNNNNNNNNNKNSQFKNYQNQKKN